MMSSPKSVQVAVRVRPLVANECEKGCLNILEVFGNERQIQLKTDSDKAFTYNHVFDICSTQEQFYNTAVKDLLVHFFDGYNLTVLAYGQTGSGKTYTMGTTYTSRNPQDMGVIPRAINDIFDEIDKSVNFNFKISVSFMELYKETLYDLLANKPRDQCLLELREDASKGVQIPGLTELSVTCSRDIFDILERGSAGRATATTNMNAQSSRSHAIFTIYVNMMAKDNSISKNAKFHMVDLAGSERVKKTGAIGNTFKEGVNINKGLLVLGNVISALGDDKVHHSYIPFRDSNLTRLLKDSLGGNSITLMIACVSPADYNLEETLSTLRYANRAKRIQNKPIINECSNTEEINELKRSNQQLRLQLNERTDYYIQQNETLRKSNKDLSQKVRLYAVQISASLAEKTDLLERFENVHNINDELLSHQNCLETDADNFTQQLQNCIEISDNHLINGCLDKYQLIKDQIGVIGNKFAVMKEIFNQQEANCSLMQYGLVESESDNEFSEKHDSYTQKQLGINLELREISRNLNSKQQLLEQIANNSRQLIDTIGMAENERRIQLLERERDDLQQLLQASKTSTASENYRKRIEELQNQLQELKRKVADQARLIKLKNEDEAKIKGLRDEILHLKQARVHCMRKIREESEKFRVWRLEWQREVATLRRQDRQKQGQITRMQTINNNQQLVLKRKVEEAVMLKKRLKEAEDKRRQAQQNRSLVSTGSVDRISVWFKHELDVALYMAEAEVTRNDLQEERTALNVKLNALKKSNDSDADEIISSIQSQIQLRSVQIADLAQKMADYYDDTKYNQKFDGIHSVGQAKHVLKMLFEYAIQLKKDDFKKSLKVDELATEITQLNESINNITQSNTLQRNEWNTRLTRLEEQCEEKVAILINEMKKLKEECNLKEQQIVQEKLEKEQLIKKNETRDKQVCTLSQEMFEVQTISESIHMPKKQSRNKKVTRPVNSKKVDILKEQNYITDSSMEIDDTDKDPDWRKTPVSKWVKERNIPGQPAGRLRKTNYSKLSYSDVSKSSIEDVRSREDTSVDISGSPPKMKKHKRVKKMEIL